MRLTIDSGVKSYVKTLERPQTYLIDILVVDLDHGSIDTGAKALDLTQSEQTIFTGSVHLNVSMVLDGLDDVSGSSDHAGGGTAHLEVVLPHLGTVEHRVE